MQSTAFSVDFRIKDAVDCILFGCAFGRCLLFGFRYHI